MSLGLIISLSSESDPTNMTGYLFLGLFRGTEFQLKRKLSVMTFAPFTPKLKHV